MSFGFIEMKYFYINFLGRGRHNKSSGGDWQTQKGTWENYVTEFTRAVRKKKGTLSLSLSLLILCSKQYQKTVLKIQSDMLAPGCFPTLLSFSLPKIWPLLPRRVSFYWPYISLMDHWWLLQWCLNIAGLWEQSSFEQNYSGQGWGWWELEFLLLNWARNCSWVRRSRSCSFLWEAKVQTVCDAGPHSA